MNDAAPIAAASAVPVYAPGPVPAAGGEVGVLLVNLGTPEPPSRAVRRYLKEFLADRRVIENQGLLWKMVLNGIILPLRPRRKARDYQKIWNSEKNESPLKTITRSQAEKLAGMLEPLGKRHRRRLGDALRQPLDRVAARRLVARGCERILLMPLYPQYARRRPRRRRRGVPRADAMRRQPALRFAAALLRRSGLYRGAGFLAQAPRSRLRSSRT